MIIKVKIFPGSRKEEIVKERNSFEIKIKEEPREGKANKAVVSLLANYFNISENKIKLIKGFRTRNKIFKINEQNIHN